MEIVVDASVAVKWFLDEPGTPAAKRQLEFAARLIGPELVVAEVCNVLWRRVREGKVPEAQAAAAIRSLHRYYERLEPLPPLAEDALRIGLELGHPTYDCFYLALAERERTHMVTADARLLGRVRGTAFEALARPLEPPS